MELNKEQVEQIAKAFIDNGIMEYIIENREEYQKLLKEEQEKNKNKKS